MIGCCAEFAWCRLTLVIGGLFCWRFVCLVLWIDCCVLLLICWLPLVCYLFGLLLFWCALGWRGLGCCGFCGCLRAGCGSVSF